MIETHTNPIYVCTDCSAHFRSKPITLVITPDLEIPPCPACQGNLTIGSILLGLMEDPPCDDTIADRINQDYGKALKTEFQKETADFLKSRRRPIKRPPTPPTG